MTKFAKTMIAGALGATLALGAIPAAAASDFLDVAPTAAAAQIQGQTGVAAGEVEEVRFGRRGFRGGFRGGVGFKKFRGGHRGAFFKKGFKKKSFGYRGGFKAKKGVGFGKFFFVK